MSSPSQVAVKNNIDVFYFSTLYPLHILFVEDGKMGEWGHGGSPPFSSNPPGPVPSRGSPQKAGIPWESVVPEGGFGAPPLIPEPLPQGGWVRLVSGGVLPSALGGLHSLT